MLLKIDDVSFVSSLTIRYDTMACITQNKHTVAGFRLPKPRTVAVLVDDIFPRDQVLSFKYVMQSIICEVPYSSSLSLSYCSLQTCVVEDDCLKKIAGHPN